jgi:ABC-type multidrug transport system fused ATPase/permease subunit
MKGSIVFLSRFILREKRLFLTGVFFTAFVSFLTWFGPKMIAHIIDDGLVPGNRKVALAGVGFLALSEVFRLSSIFLSQVAYASLGQNVIERVRKGMVSHLLKLPVPYFDQVSSGSMMTRIVNDVNSLTDFFQSGFVSVLGNFASVGAIFFGLFTLNFKLGLILFSAFIPIAILCCLFSIRLRAVYEETRNRLSELNAKLADFLFGMRTVRALGLGSRKYQELNRNVQDYAGSQMKMVGTFALFHPTLSFGIGALLMLLIGLGIPLISTGALQIGQWVAALSYVLVLQQPLIEISDRWNFFIAGLTSIDRIREVFAEIPEHSGSITAPSFASIDLQNVEFRYPEGKTRSLNQVTIRLNKGDWIGIHGESGSGKSTFLQMLYGFYRPNTGSIFWNGRPYADYELSSLRSHFGVVEQFPFLFHGTIRDNINLFGRFTFSESELKQVFIGYPLIESLLCMLDFEISERGENLSMGQKQMITFLRAYLAKPEVWVLDEATAFFDHEAEEEVLRALDSLAVGVTVIQVAHRPEALVRMKRMIEVAHGRLIEKQQSLR